MRKLLKKINPEFLQRLAGEIFAVTKELRRETGVSYLTLLLDISLSVLNFVRPNEYRMYRFYEKSCRARNRFLTEYRKTQVCSLLNPQKYRSLFDNKNEFHQYFSEFTHRKWLFAPEVSDQQIEDFLREQRQVIAKPHNRDRGEGVYKLCYSEVTDIKVFCESARRDTLILEEIIKQHPDLSSINSSSVNTVRIYTMLDKENVPHILFANLRMGTEGTVVDNLNSGGVIAQIDLDSGVLFTRGAQKNLQTHVKHPTSGVVLPGFQVPHWEAVKKMVLHTATMSPKTRWVGWDVAITEQVPLLLEGNMEPGVEGTQSLSQMGVLPILQGYL